MGQVIADRVEPYLKGIKEPQIKNYFFVVWSGGVFMGGRATDNQRVDELVPVINQAIRGFPDTIAFAKRASLFGGFGAGRTIDMNLQGRSLEALMKAALVAYVSASEAMPGARIRPFPGLELAEPELRLVPNERRIAEAGWNRGTMALVTRALGEGLYVGDYFDGEDRLDIVVRVQPWATPEQLAAIPLATPDAGVLPVGELTRVVRTAGPNEIRRLDRRRTVTLQITPPQGLSLEEALNTLRQQVEPAVEALLPEDGEIRYTGTADKLETALVQHERQLPARDRHFVSFDERIVPLVHRQPAGNAGAAPGNRRRGDRAPLRKPRGLSTHGPADHDWVHHPARSGCQQRHPAGASDTGGRASRSFPARRGGAGGRIAVATHFDEHPDQHLRDGALAAQSRRRHRALSRSRCRHRRGNERKHHIHFVAVAKSVTDRRR